MAPARQTLNGLRSGRDRPLAGTRLVLAKAGWSLRIHPWAHHRRATRRRYAAQRTWTSAPRSLIVGSPLPIRAPQTRHADRLSWAPPGFITALARKVLGSLRVMSLHQVGESTVAPTDGARITQRVVATRSPRPETCSRGVGTARPGHGDLGGHREARRDLARAARHLPRCQGRSKGVPPAPMENSVSSTDPNALYLVGMAAQVVGAFDQSSTLLAMSATRLRAQGRLGLVDI